MNATTPGRPGNAAPTPRRSLAEETELFRRFVEDLRREVRGLPLERPKPPVLRVIQGGRDS